MKKLLPLSILLCTSWLANAQQNVGIGTNNPETKLQVNGAISFVPSENDAAATVVIPDNVSAFRLRLVPGGGTTALSVNSGKEGQMLTIYNQDDNIATFASVNIIATTGSATFMYMNGAWRMTASNSVSGPQGPVGPQGPAGAVGAQGPQGITGATGQTGSAGVAGAVGPQGPAGPQGTAGAAGAVGAQGPAGTPGAVGAQGPAGPQGTAGTAGAVGAQGPQGVQGPAGAAGAVGPQGAQGPAGTLSAGSAAGNTTYWDGSTWVLNSSNVFNNGSNVGIGSSAPNSKLEVAKTVTHTYPTPGLGFGTLNIAPNTNATADQSAAITFSATQNVSGAQAGIYVQSSGAYGTKMYFGTTNSYATGSQARMMIDHNGNVGIGYISPTHTLDVNGIVNAATGYRVNGAAPAANVYMKGDGTKFTAGTIQASDVPTLNQNTTGWATYLKSPYPYNINISDATAAGTLCEPGSLSSVNMHASHGLFGSWATTLTMSGYERYGAYQISGNYNAATPELAIRNYVQSTNTWNSWTKVITAANIGSYGDNLGNHTATTTLNLNGNVLSNAQSIRAVGDHLELMSGQRAVDGSYEWMGLYSGGTRQGIFLWDGAWAGANNVANEFSLTAEGNNLLTLNTSNNHIALMPKNGNVGIGTLAPTSKLHVIQTADASKYVINGYAAQTTTSADYQNIGVYGYGRGGNATWGYGAGVMGIGDQANSYYAVGVYAGLGTGPINLATVDAALYANGNGLGYSAYFNNTAFFTGGGVNAATISANGSYYSDWVSGWGGGLQTWDICAASIKYSGLTSRSDFRLKKDIGDVNRDMNALEIVKQLKPVSYYWIDERLPKNKRYGFIAQEVEKLVPDLVDTGTDSIGTKSLNYVDMVSILTRAMQQQQEEIEKLKQASPNASTPSNTELMIEIQALKREIEALKKNK